MSAQHTPGPWFMFANGQCIGGPAGPLGNPSGADTAGIAHCGMGLRTSAETQANARLIAAAPDLLDVARMARDMISTERQSFADCNVVPELTEGDDPDNFISIGGALFEQHDADVVADYDRALAKIDAAIAKAIGSAA